MQVSGFPRGAAESTDRKPGTQRLTRTSSGEAGAQLGHPAQSSPERAGPRRPVLPGAPWGGSLVRPLCPHPAGSRRGWEASPRETLTHCQAGTFYSGPASPLPLPSPPPRCAQEGIQKGLSRERLRAGCGNGVKAYANRPSSAFLRPVELEPVSRRMLLLQTLDCSPSLDGTAGGVRWAGPGLDCKEGGFVLTLEGLCVSSALRTEFHGLCQCQTCEVQFFSWDSSVIVDPRNTGESSGRTWKTGDGRAKPRL